MPSGTASTSHAPSHARRLRRSIRNIRGSLVALLALFAFALGFWGFVKAQNEVDPHIQPWQAVYRSVQIFTFHAGEEAQGNWQLEVARWLAPASLGLATIVAVLALLGEQARLLGLRFRRKHIVISGLGVKGFKLARELDDAGELVVVIEQNEGNKSIEGCRERHIPVVKGDATDENLLRKAGAIRASGLIVTCGDDNANLQVAFSARRLVEARPRGVLTAAVHLDDLGLLRRLHGLAASTHAFRLDFFSVAETGARILLEKHPPFGDTKTRSTVALIGLGALGEHLVLHIARTWRDRENGPAGPLPIILLGPSASGDLQLLLRRYPELKGICDLEAHSADIASPEFEQAVSVLHADGGSREIVVYVCLGRETEALEVALALNDQLESRQARIVLVVEDETMGVATAVGSGAARLGCVEVFGILSSALTRDLILGGVHEILARVAHEHYLRAEQAKGITPEENPSMVSWDLLPESLKESSRRFADGISAKLEATGCVPVPAPLAHVDGDLFHFSEEEIESLAEMEHERWCTDLVNDGWKPTQREKDPERKEHPLLVTWSELSEAERDKDRELVRTLPRVLAEGGFEIHRVRGAPADRVGESHG